MRAVGMAGFRVRLAAARRSLDFARDDGRGEEVPIRLRSGQALDVGRDDGREASFACVRNPIGRARGAAIGRSPGVFAYLAMNRMVGVTPA
jgi:hypothetical protein